jgi:hypothetical protein
MKIGLLTCERIPLLLEGDQQVLSLLQNHGFDVDALVWSDESIDWESYDCLIFRNTWDYFERENDFRAWINYIKLLEIPTLNDLNVIEKNIHKFYLKDLENKGIVVIPTIYLEKGQAFDLNEILPSQWAKSVIKPAFSAGSFQTEIIYEHNKSDHNQRYNELILSKDLLLQKFMPEIQIVGETSFVFFNRNFSHCINKMPKDGDFRVQSQFGGLYKLVDHDANILLQVEKIIEAIEGDLLYARVDGIIIDEVFHLMEVELIEPDLYLDKKDGATSLFAQSIIEKVNLL